MFPLVTKIAVVVVLTLKFLIRLNYGHMEPWEIFK